MIKQYTHQDIAKWADYSGDRNQVHFDKGFAVKNGLNDVIVQGMRILLDAKEMMIPYINSDVAVNFYIKKPVLVNTNIEYSIKQNKNKTRLIVSTLDKPEEVCVTATILAEPPPVLDKLVNQIRVSAEFIQYYVDLLLQYYPHIKTNWLLIDTLLFCISFNQQKNTYFRKQAQKINVDTNHHVITTYHVAQKIFISERLLKNHIDFQALSYAINEKDIYSQKDSVYSTFTISAIEEDGIIYQSSIECMTKASEII